MCPPLHAHTHTNPPPTLARSPPLPCTLARPAAGRGCRACALLPLPVPPRSRSRPAPLPCSERVHQRQELLALPGALRGRLRHLHLPQDAGELLPPGRLLRGETARLRARRAGPVRGCPGMCPPLLPPALAGLPSGVRSCLPMPLRPFKKASGCNHKQANEPVTFLHLKQLKAQNICIIILYYNTINWQYLSGFKFSYEIVTKRTGSVANSAMIY